MRNKQQLERAGRLGLPAVFLALLLRPRSGARTRVGALAGLLAVWSAVYAVYRRRGLRTTAHEYELMATATPEAYTRHYNEHVPTTEEEFDLWGEYHRHRHEMRYDIVAAEARRHLPVGGRLLDIGCGATLVADRLLDIDADYVGLEYGGNQVAFAAKKVRESSATMRRHLIRADGARLPLADNSIDVVVFTEVIEHLMQPELAVWEISRVLKPGGHLVMTTNNASEMPLRSPLSHLFAWLEKAIAATHDRVISIRPWVWPWPVSPELLPPGAPYVYLPHTHHIQAETRRMFAAAGMNTVSWSTFEFPPPQSRTAQWLDRHGELGRRLVDALESLCQATPGLRRLGCRLLMVAERSGVAAPEPPPGIWPGPFSK
ncbi:MAG: class I SAM-dependent methyltransferase [Actinomycetes bacterium]